MCLGGWCRLGGIVMSGDLMVIIQGSHSGFSLEILLWDGRKIHFTCVHSKKHTLLKPDICDATRDIDNWPLSYICVSVITHQVQ